MSGFAIVWGHLRMPAAAEKKWRKASVDPSAWSDWPEEVSAEETGEISVGDAFDEIEEWGEGCFLRLDRTGDDVAVVGMLHEDAYRDMEAPLLVAFRAAANAGATGTVYLADDQMVDYGWSVRLDGGRSKVEALDLDAARRDVLPKAMRDVTSASP
jgi:hypothetical protein